MGWRRVLLSAVVTLVAWPSLAVDLPAGPFCLDFELSRTQDDAWCELTLGAGPSAGRVGLSARRASIASSAAGYPTSSADGNALPPKGTKATYRLVRSDDFLSVERDGAVLVQGYVGCRSAASLDARVKGCTVRLADPQPTEAVYFEDDFLRTDQDDGGWQPLRGKWRVGEYRDKLVAALNLAPQATWYECADSGLAVTGSSWWHDLKLSADLRSDAPAGLAFAVQGTRYGLLRLRGGQVELLLVSGDRETPLASAAFKPEPGRWVRLAVVSSRGRALATINGRTVLNAAAPTLGTGQVGAWCAGPAQFDNFRAEEQQLAWDPLAKGLPDVGLWRTNSPTRSRLAPFDSGLASATAVLARDGRGALTMTATQPLALEVSRQGAQRRYAFRSGVTVVAEGDLVAKPDARYALSLRRRGPQFEALIDGARVGLTAQAGAPPSEAGVTPGGVLSDVLVRVVPDEPDALVSRADLDPLREDWVGRDESLRTVPDVWRPESGNWRTHDSRLVGRADAQPARIWYRDALPADTGLSVTIEELSPGASLMLIVGGGPGLRLVVSAGEAVLTRDGVDVAKTGLAQPPGNARLWRDEAWVLADVDGQRLAWRDPKPTGGGQLMLRLSAGGSVVLSDVRVTAQNGFASSFGAVDTLWRETGDWQWTSGMACIAWSYWLTGDGRQAPAWLWRREALGHDVTVAFEVSEHTDGYDQGDTDHRHFPYNDVSLMLDGDGQNADSGYRFVIGENHGHGVRLLRRGQSVAFDDGLRIVMGGHCNSPRAIRTLATRNGARITLTCNGRQVISWDDPQPLAGGGVVGLGVKDCRANFHDLVALRYRQP
ncbi:MAG: hypothetical protein HZB16_12305 [Armatimonadetes bacterium]|nr:hypothetical protein [Armatimonadota bacterium]